jgi:hypothetical protein
MAEKYITPENQKTILAELKKYIDAKNVDEPQVGYRVRGFVAIVGDLITTFAPAADYDLAIVLNDTTQNGGKSQSSFYEYVSGQWTYKTALEIPNRDFANDPVALTELSTELQTIINSLQFDPATDKEIDYLLFDVGIIEWYAIAEDANDAENFVEAATTYKGFRYAKTTLQTNDDLRIEVEYPPTQTGNESQNYYIKVETYNYSHTLINTQTGNTTGNLTYYINDLNSGDYFIRVGIYTDSTFTTPTTVDETITLLIG